MFQKESGFTLVELVVVLSVIAIIASYALINFSATNKLKAQTTAKQLATNMSYTQVLAMTSGNRYRINFAPQTYTITTLDGLSLVLAPVRLLNGLTLNSTGLPSNYIVFDQQGIPYTDNTIPGTPLSAEATITLTLKGSIVQTLTITPETGKVIIKM